MNLLITPEKCHCTTLRNEELVRLITVVLIDSESGWF